MCLKRTARAGGLGRTTGRPDPTPNGETMKEADVPQDPCLFGPHRAVCYAVADGGEYVCAPTAGWGPSNVANLQAWEVVRADAERARAQVERGEASPLVFLMACHQMDLGLLAQYVGLPRRQVKRHLQPGGLARLGAAERARYAQVFGVAPAALDALPEGFGDSPLGQVLGRP